MALAWENSTVHENGSHELFKGVIDEVDDGHSKKSMRKKRSQHRTNCRYYCCCYYTKKLHATLRR